MSANPIDNNSTPKPTGSLEDLFRHHLGEEAAVPPRPMLWEQIDNSLLVRQNETYRRRLAATRWVAAASLLLATLAGSGWWTYRAADLAATEVAQAARTTEAAGAADAAAANATTAGNGMAGRRAAPAPPTPRSDASNTALASAATGRTDGALNSRRAASATGHSSAASPAVAAASASRTTGFGTAAVRNGLETGTTASATATATAPTGFAGTTAGASSAPAGSLAGAEGTATGTQVSTIERATAATGSERTGLSRPANAAGQGFDAAEASIAGTASAPAPAADATRGAAALTAAAPASAAAIGFLAANPASLTLTSPEALPSGLTALPGTEPALATAAQRWHYGAAYTAGLFNPNINFSRAGIDPQHDYNPALGADSPGLTEAAAAQYRANLRPGLTQRLALLATRHLGGHWSLSTGAEFTQASAKSATTVSFLGEQVPDFGQSSTGPLRTTDFRYRTAGIPAEVSYGNSAKRGWSLYGRLGGAVTALLGVRSEVEGNPEATRTYSLLSAGTPYRRVLATVRGGAGTQFRPKAGNWALRLGPTAESGLLSLNAHPAQGFAQQSRPYSFGIEAGVEFGR